MQLFFVDLDAKTECNIIDSLLHGKKGVTKKRPPFDDPFQL
jgi:hypothetical protein